MTESMRLQRPPPPQKVIYKGVSVVWVKTVLKYLFWGSKYLTN